MHAGDFSDGGRILLRFDRGISKAGVADAVSVLVSDD
jgi:hypothetical protein